MDNNTTKIAFIVEDFSTLGGIQIVTNHLINGGDACLGYYRRNQSSL